MLIEGPLKIAIADPADGVGKILVMGFQPEFQALPRERQGAVLRGYLEQLGANARAIPDPADRNRIGMLIVQQVAEQLLPHVEAGELALEETITVQIRQDQQAVALSSLLAPE